jgi:hypothetical protein
MIDDEEVTKNDILWATGTVGLFLIGGFAVLKKASKLAYRLVKKS